MDIIFDFIKGHGSDFIIETFACFLGFFSGLITEAHLERKKDKATKKTVIEGIKNELTKVIEVLNQMGPDDFGIDLYNCPFWNSIVSTGQVDLIADDERYEDIISVYYKLLTANSWEKINTEYCIEHECLNVVISGKVSETRNELRTMTSNLISRL